MSGILSRLRNVKEEDVNYILRHELETQAKDSLELRYLWQNEDQSPDVLSLFCDYIKKRKTNPEVQFQSPEENLSRIYNTNFFKSE